MRRKTPPAETEISTVKELMGVGDDFWKREAPHLAGRSRPTEIEIERGRRRAAESNSSDPADAASWAMVFARRRRINERSDFLIQGGYLSGEALEYAMRRDETHGR